MSSVAIVVFPGTNREGDAAKAVQSLTNRVPDIVWHKDRFDAAYDLVVLPGGFSYGDYLRCGAMAAHAPVMTSVHDHVKRGGRVLAICNGFQIAVEAGLLPGALLRNASLRFVCRRVQLEAVATNGILPAGTVLEVPVAHGEGSYYADDDLLNRLEDNDQIAFRYGAGDNPNGSVRSIAGITNVSKTILGMMPHPENAALPHHRNQSGRLLFETLLTRIL